MTAGNDIPANGPDNSAGPRLIVLDRDGVINRESPAFIKSPDEWQPLPGSLAAIARLCNSGYTVVVASNQSGIGRGLFSGETLDRIHEEMLRQVREAGGEITGLFVCPHAPEAGCDCRKPLPGLMKQIERRFGVSLQNVPAIGDSERDIQAAAAAGARPILVRTGNGRQTEQALRASLQDALPEVFDDLAEAADRLIRTIES